MATPAIEGRLPEIHGPIGQPDASGPAGAAEVGSRTQRHLDTPRGEEAEGSTAVRQARDAVEDRIRQLEIKLDIAKHLLAAELAGDAGTFVGAVEAELHDWDAYLEWLQVRAAMRAGAGSAREQAEAGIRELRRHRNTVAEHLAEVRAASGEVWREQKKPLAAAREELERKVNEVLATLD